jgi:Leucine-rich repeat (LRR) protein
LFLWSDISRTGFNAIPDVVFALASSLKVLEISGLGLESLPDDVTKLSLLTRINLGYNRFKAIPTQIYKLSNMEEILIDNNSVSELDAEALLGLKSLKVLDINCNDLTDLPPRLGLHEGLRVLEIEGNGIKSLKRSTIESGCNEILRCLRDRIPQ